MPSMGSTTYRYIVYMFIFCLFFNFFVSPAKCDINFSNIIILFLWVSLPFILDHRVSFWYPND